MFQDMQIPVLPIVVGGINHKEVTTTTTNTGMGTVVLDTEGIIPFAVVPKNSARIKGEIVRTGGNNGYIPYFTRYDTGAALESTSITYELYYSNM